LNGKTRPENVCSFKQSDPGSAEGFLVQPDQPSSSGGSSSGFGSFDDFLQIDVIGRNQAIMA
jgi:hypothetical protein